MQPQPSPEEQAAMQPQMQPQPTPVQWNIQQALTPQGPIVVLQLFLLTGTTVVFLPTDGADELARQLAAAAKTGSTGLLLPPSVRL